ncbi:STAS domain-containing protein [Kitasatospora sp. NPDC005856]|uniref:STAS domain-containing protein n=1 Tax=Kitasatospora sp. NPDC005856 TaxID=3154566 RepID=UPI0033F7F104
MSIDARITVRQGIATVTLGGQADAASVDRIDRLLVDVVEQRPRQLVLDVSELSYLSSAGLRCLVRVHQQLGRDVEIVLLNPSEEVAETVRLTGFDHSLTVQHRRAG